MEFLTVCGNAHAVGGTTRTNKLLRGILFTTFLSILNKSHIPTVLDKDIAIVKYNTIPNYISAIAILLF